MHEPTSSILSRVVERLRDEFPARFGEEWSPPDASTDERVELRPLNPSAATMTLVSSIGAVWIFVEGFTNESPALDDLGVEEWTLDFCQTVARHGLWVREGWLGGMLGRRLFVQHDPPRGHESMTYRERW